MNHEKVIILIKRVYEISSTHFPEGDIHADELLSLGKDLETYNNDRQKRIILEAIKRFLSAGMGGFTDNPLLPKPGVDLKELNKEFRKLCNELYIEVVKILDEK